MGRPHEPGSRIGYQHEHAQRPSRHISEHRVHGPRRLLCSRFGVPDVGAVDLPHEDQVIWRQPAGLRQYRTVGLHGERVVLDPEAEVQALIGRPADATRSARERRQHAGAQVRPGRDQAIAGSRAHFRKSGTSSSSSSSNTTDLRRVLTESAGLPAPPARAPLCNPSLAAWLAAPSGPGRGAGIPSILVPSLEVPSESACLPSVAALPPCAWSSSLTAGAAGVLAARADGAIAYGALLSVSWNGRQSVAAGDAGADAAELAAS